MGAEIDVRLGVGCREKTDYETREKRERGDGMDLEG